MKDVREILKKRPLLFDGGMGTYYKAKPGQECEQANLLDPDGILTVHRAYLEAGADAIKTNTFGLPRMAAAQNPMWEAMADEGWKLAAQAAAKTSAAVFADLGPAPDTEALPAAQIYTALAERFAALGAKNFLFETLSSDAGVAEAARQIKEAVPDAFVLVSFAVLPDGYTREGRHCAELVRSMTACGAVDAVGLNCVSAPGAMRALVQQLGETKLPLAVMPNAGYPVVTRTRVQYQGRPEYFARELARLAAEGVRILGGCCGTTPAHIAALRAALDALPETLPAAPAAAVSTAAKPEVEKDDAFLRKLNAGKKVIAIELDSPKDADLTGYLDGARRLQAAGADLLTIVIDYLQLMSGSGGRSSDSRQQEISDISRSLKAVARELSVPVLALSQLSRAVEQRPDHRPMLSDLRESGAIEQDADVVMFIYRDDYYNHDSPDKGISEIIIAKQRNGPIGTVQLAWLPEYTKFANLENDRKKDF